MGSDVTEQKPRWLDTTISLQWVLGVLGGAIAAIILWALALSVEVRDQRKDIDGLKRAAVDARDDNRAALRDINQNIKDLSGKVDSLKDQMIANSVAARPDMQRWAK